MHMCLVEPAPEIPLPIADVFLSPCACHTLSPVYFHNSKSEKQRWLKTDSQFAHVLRLSQLAQIQMVLCTVDLISVAVFCT